MNIYFDKSLKGTFLNAQKLATDEAGYVIDITTKSRVTGEDKKPIKAEEFAGVRRGSRIFLSNGIDTIIEEATLEAAHQR